MSCQLCDSMQEIVQVSEPDPDSFDNGLEIKGATYIRVGAANVMIAGCQTHLEQLIKIFRKGLESEK